MMTMITIILFDYYSIPLFSTYFPRPYNKPLFGNIVAYKKNPTKPNQTTAPAII